MRRKIQSSLSSRGTTNSQGAAVSASRRTEIANQNQRSSSNLKDGVQTDNQKQILSSLSHHPIYTRGVNNEWESLLRVFFSKKQLDFLSMLGEITLILRDTNTQSWQQRQHSIKQIPSVLNDAVDHIFSSQEIVDVVLQNYPELLGQVTLKSHQVVVVADGSARTTESSFSQSTNFQGQGSPTRKNQLNHVQATKSQMILKRRQSGQQQQVQGPIDKDFIRKNIKFNAVSWILRIVQPFIISQLTDLRISVVREACLIILWMARQFPDEFYLNKQDKLFGGGAVTCSYDQMQQSLSNASAEVNFLLGGNGIGYLKEDALPKLLQTSNKLFQELGHLTIKELLGFSRSTSMDKLILYLSPLLNSNDAQVRARAMEYFEKVLKNALSSSGAEARHLVNQNADLIDYAILKSSEDVNSEVRQFSISSSNLYYKLQPLRCQELIQNAMAHNQVKRILLYSLKLNEKNTTGSVDSKSDGSRDLSGVSAYRSDSIQKSDIISSSPIDQHQDQEQLKPQADNNSAEKYKNNLNGGTEITQLKFKLDIVNNIKNSVTRTKKLKDQFEGARTVQDFERILVNSDLIISRDLNSGLKSVEKEKQEPTQIQPSQGNNRVAKHRFSLFDDYKKNQYSPKVQSQRTQLEQFQTNNSLMKNSQRQSPPAVIQQKARYLEMTQSMNNKRVNAIQIGKYNTGQNGSKSPLHSSLWNQRQVQNAKQRLNSPKIMQNSKLSEFGQHNSLNELDSREQANQQRLQNKMFARVHKLYKNIKKDHVQQKQTQGLRSFSGLIKERLHSRNYRHTENNESVTDSHRTQNPQHNLPLNSTKFGGFQKSTNQFSSKSSLNITNQSKRSGLDQRDGIQSMDQWKRNDSRSDISDRILQRSSISKDNINQTLNAETVQKYDKYLNQFPQKSNQSMLQVTKNLQDVQASKISSQQSALVNFNDKQKSVSRTGERAIDKTAAETGERSNESIDRLRSTNFYQQAVRNKCRQNSVGAGSNYEDSSLKIKDTKNQLLQPQRETLVNPETESRISTQRASVSINLNIQSRMAFASRSNSPKELKNSGVITPSCESVDQRERGLSSRDDSSMIKDEVSVATTNISSRVRVSKKDRVRNRVAAVLEAPPIIYVTEEIPKQVKSNTDAVETISPQPLIYEVNEPKKDRDSAQAQSKSSNNGMSPRVIGHIVKGAGRFSKNAQISPKNQKHLKNFQTLANPGDIVQEVTLGRESDGSHITSLGEPEICGVSQKQATKDSIKAQDEVSKSDPTTKDYKKMLDLEKSEQTPTEKIEDFRESINELEEDAFSPDDLEQPKPNVLLPVQHPAPQPFQIPPMQIDPQLINQGLFSAVTNQSCNVADQAEEHLPLMSSSTSQESDNAGQIELAPDIRQEDAKSGVDQSEDSSKISKQEESLDQAYALAMSTQAMLEIDKQKTISSKLTQPDPSDVKQKQWPKSQIMGEFRGGKFMKLEDEDIGNGAENLQSEDDEELVLNLQVVESEGRGAGRGQLEARSREEEYEPTLKEETQVKEKVIQEKDQLPIQEIKEEKSSLQQVDEESSPAQIIIEDQIEDKDKSKPKETKILLKSNYKPLNKEVDRKIENNIDMHNQHDQIIIIENSYDADEGHSNETDEHECSSQFTQYSSQEDFKYTRQLSKIDEVQAEYSEDRSDEKIKERQSMKDVQGSRESNLNEQIDPSSEEISSQQSSDYKILLYRITCNQKYDPVMERTLGCFNTEPPIEKAKMKDHFDERIEITCDLDQDNFFDYSEEVDQQSRQLDKSLNNKKQGRHSSPSQQNPSSHHDSNPSQNSLDRSNLQQKPQQKTTTERTPKKSPKKIDELTSSDQNTENKRNQEINLISISSSKPQNSEQCSNSQTQSRPSQNKLTGPVQIDSSGNSSSKTSKDQKGPSIANNSPRISDSSQNNQILKPILENDEEMLQKIDSQIQRRQKQLKMMNQKSQEAQKIGDMKIIRDSDQQSAKVAKDILKNTFNHSPDSVNSMLNRTGNVNDNNLSDINPLRDLTSKSISRHGRHYGGGPATDQYSSMNDQKLFWNLMCEADQGSNLTFYSGK